MYKDQLTPQSDLSANNGGAFRIIWQALDENTRIEKRKPLWSAAVTVAMVAVLGAVLWYTYPKEAQKQEILSVPIIRADAGPYKAAPVDPGGMEIPYQDSTVYNTLQADAGSAAHKAARVMPDAEQPIDRSLIFAGLEDDDSAVDGEDVLPPQVAMAQEKVKMQLEAAKRKAMEEITLKPIEHKEQKERQIVVAPDQIPEELKQFMIIEDTAQKKGTVAGLETRQATTEDEPVAAPKVAVMPKITPAAPLKTAEQPKPVEPVAEKVAVIDTATMPKIPSPAEQAEREEAEALAGTEPAAGPAMAEPVKMAEGYFVQLGSVGEEAVAEKEWLRYKKIFAAEIGDSGYRVQRADLGARGVYYRVQAGPLEKEQAFTMCETIKEKKPGGCLVIRP